jgi:hypothetical protein
MMPLMLGDEREPAGWARGLSLLVHLRLADYVGGALNEVYVDGPADRFRDRQAPPLRPLIVRRVRRLTRK